MTKGLRAHGFTLMEILVALVLLGLIVGALTPTVITQITRGEINRLVRDLNGIESAAKAFRVDVQRWPGSLEDLVSRPTGSDTDLNGNTYPAGLQARWTGPYLERGTIPEAGLPTALGGTILNDFDKLEWGESDFLTVYIIEIPEADAERVSMIVDGDDDTGTGRVRWGEGGEVESVMQPDTLIFLAAPT